VLSPGGGGGGARRRRHTGGRLSLSRRRFLVHQRVLVQFQPTRIHPIWTIAHRYQIQNLFGERSVSPPVVEEGWVVAVIICVGTVGGIVVFIVC
jgi:hypothetical protein